MSCFNSRTIVIIENVAPHLHINAADEQRLTYTHQCPDINEPVASPASKRDDLGTRGDLLYQLNPLLYQSINVKRNKTQIVINLGFLKHTLPYNQPPATCFRFVSMACGWRGAMCIYGIALSEYSMYVQADLR